MWMITKNLPFILLLLFQYTFLAISQMNQDNCSPSACGIIRNISFPFRLPHDPKHCGYSDYELACENNVTFTYLNSQKHQVKAINYSNFTIRLVHVSVNNNTSSFPIHFAYSDPYSYHTQMSVNDTEVAWPINYMSCPYPLKNSPFLELTNGSKHHAYYIKVGHMKASDVGEMCTVEAIVMTSWKFEDLKNVSISEIRSSLLYGFEVSWFRYPCSRCRKRLNCLLREDHTASCPGGSGYFVLLILVLVIVIFAGVSIPAMIIFGFACALVLYLVVFKDIPVTFAGSPNSYILVYIGLSYFAKNIILFPCMIGWLIYKFRRRNLSMYDAIEEFLQSDNKLMPIRYSYSNIRKITGGFREKLGQGGYGTVYKGKLRSGYGVAVKLLEKPGGNDQDFMNEIATIGRIHHVNVVNLVGYCAERSKRALVFDFMPNGSLDKYIYDREKMNCLSWERKYNVVVGVARGIDYLHTGCDIQILHFDIKPHNILLDDKFTPKITDFGLAKIFSTDKNTVTMTAIRGTIGYVAPELINRGIGDVSYKADVYSFGMLLMEMVGLNRNSNGENQASSQYFPCWIYDCFEQGQDIDVGISDDSENDANKKIARKMTIVALWCIQMSPNDRPSMNRVVEMLEAPVERLRVPNRPSQSTRVAVINVDQSWSTYSTNSTSLPSTEINTVNV